LVRLESQQIYTQSELAGKAFSALRSRVFAAFHLRINEMRIVDDLGVTGLI
jgi:hypothetical protein